jgi:hypothetical protein
MKRECSPATASPQTPGLAGGFALGPAQASHDKARQVASGLGWGSGGGGAQKRRPNDRPFSKSEITTKAQAPPQARNQHTNTDCRMCQEAGGL